MSAPVISAGGALSAFLVSFLVLGLARLLERSAAIEKNSRETADLLRRLFKDQQPQG